MTMAEMLRVHREIEEENERHEQEWRGATPSRPGRESVSPIR